MSQPVKKIVKKLQTKRFSISKKTIRFDIPWYSLPPKLIRDVSKQKHLEWALANRADNRKDVNWTYETSVQVESQQWSCCRKNGQKPRYKAKPEYPVIVHIWAE